MNFVVIVMLVLFTALPSLPREKVSPAPSASPHDTAPGALLSRRALRNARLLIQMRLLELRSERLECVRAAILRRLPADLVPPGSDSDGAKQCKAAPGTYRRSYPSYSEVYGWQLRAVLHPKPTG
jgi:hypothetical protein